MTTEVTKKDRQAAFEAYWQGDGIPTYGILWIDNGDPDDSSEALDAFAETIARARSEGREENGSLRTKIAILEEETRERMLQNNALNRSLERIGEALGVPHGTSIIEAIEKSKVAVPNAVEFPTKPEDSCSHVPCVEWAYTGDAEEPTGKFTLMPHDDSCEGDCGGWFRCVWCRSVYPWCCGSDGPGIEAHLCTGCWMERDTWRPGVYSIAIHPVVVYPEPRGEVHNARMRLGLSPKK